MSTSKSAKPAKKARATKKAPAKRNTKTTARVVKNTKATNTKIANRLKNTAEDAGDRVEEAAQSATGRVVNITKSAIEFQRENVEAIIESGKLTAEGALLLGRTNMSFTRDNLVAASRAMQGLASRGTPRQLAARQVNYLLGGVKRVVVQVAANVEIAAEVTGNVYQPIGTRLDKIKSAASKAAA